MYKGKLYQLFCYSKIKREGMWIDVVIYKCLYNNLDGMIWVREKSEFDKLFTLVED